MNLQMAQCARQKDARDASVGLAREVRGKKCNGHRRIQRTTHLTLKNEWLPPCFNLWNGSGKPIPHVISF